MKQSANLLVTATCLLLATAPARANGYEDINAWIQVFPYLLPAAAMIEALIACFAFGARFFHAFGYALLGSTVSSPALLLAMAITQDVFRYLTSEDILNVLLVLPFLVFCAAVEYLFYLLMMPSEMEWLTRKKRAGVATLVANGVSFVLTAPVAVPYASMLVNLGS